WDFEKIQQLLIPFLGVDVEEHRPAGIGDVGQMGSSCAQLPYQPGVHRTKSQFSSLCPLSCTFYVFEHPSDFGSRKIRVDDQSGLGGNRLGKSFVFELVASSRSPPILPGDRSVDWFAGLPVPDDGRLPLVGD